jgi:hypothetical protein
MSSTIQDKDLYRPVAGTVRKPIAPALFAIRGKLSPRTDLIIGLSAIMLLIAIWCLVSYTELVPNNFLPTPTLIWEGLVDYYQRGWLIPAIRRSCWRVIQALFWVILLGLPFGILLGTFAPVDAVFRKIVNGGKAVPVTAMSMLVVLWFGFDYSREERDFKRQRGLCACRARRRGKPLAGNPARSFAGSASTDLGRHRCLHRHHVDLHNTGRNHL